MIDSLSEPGTASPARDEDCHWELNCLCTSSSVPRGLEVHNMPTELARIYLAGSSLRTISRDSGIPRETLRLNLLSQGVEMRHHPIFFHSPRTSLDTDVAELLGLHAGDGWCSDEWGIALNRTDVTMRYRVVELARDVLGVEPFITLRDNTTYVRCGQPQVRSFFMDYGFPTGKKSRTVTVPPAIMNSVDGEILKAFLRGHFSADGCFSHRDTQASCRLSVASYDLREGFVILASRIGFEFHRYSSVHRSGKNKVPLNIAAISKRDEVLRWMEMVGSMCDSHLRRFSDWKLAMGSA